MLGRLRHLGSGIVMGLAGLFPGVSAGTVALLLGIHGRLIHAIANIDHRLLADMVRSMKGNAVARARIAHLDFGFVGLILAGMLVTTFTGAKTVTWLTNNHPGPIMAVFLGLIVFGSFIPWRRIEQPGWREGLMILPGALVAITLAFLPPGSLGSGIWLFFVGGLIAMPMMILPGVSGSAMLVTIGLYQDAVAAVSDFQVFALLTFLAGGVIGILTAAKGLRWLLDHYHGLTMGFLTGLLVGSVIRVWPWRTEAGFAAGYPAAPDHDLSWLAWTALASAIIITIEILSLRAHRRGLEIKDSDDEP